MCFGYAGAITAILDTAYTEPIGIEDIQNEVELMLMSVHPPTAKVYILYRQNRMSARNFTLLAKKLENAIGKGIKEVLDSRRNARGKSV